MAASGTRINQHPPPDPGTARWSGQEKVNRRRMGWEGRRDRSYASTFLLQAHVRTCAYVHVQMCMRTHTHIYANARARTHTHTHTHTHTPVQLVSIGCAARQPTDSTIRSSNLDELLASLITFHAIMGRSAMCTQTWLHHQARLQCQCPPPSCGLTCLPTPQAASEVGGAAW